MERIETTTCVKCGKQYAAVSPGCPYCSYVPIKKGRKMWMRWVIVLIGYAVTGCVTLLLYLASGGDWRMGPIPLIVGVVGTQWLANDLVGGGKDWLPGDDRLG